MTPHAARIVHASIEVPNWAPWLRFGLDAMVEYDEVFPEGQIVHLVDGEPAGSLTSVRRSWSGDPADLGTWDEVSGHDTSIAAAHDPRGSTMVMLSVSVHPESQGQGVPAELVRHARRIAAEHGLEHLISPFRPSEFGRHKAKGGDVDFPGYIARRRPDGLPVDPWLRALTRLGMRPLAVCRGAMVVPSTVAEMDAHRAAYRPEAWFRVDDDRAAVLLDGVSSDVVGAADEVWECGETGSWFVDRDGGRATYVEDNLWGELPLALDQVESGGRHEITVVPLSGLERSLVVELAERAGGAEVALAWLVASDPRAEVVRQPERAVFPEIDAFLSDEVESWCRFLVVVDLAQDPPQIGQAFRVSSHRYGDQGSAAIGMPTVDEIVAANDDVTLDGIVDHYRAEGVDLRRNIAVETSFRLPGARAGARGLRWSDFGYVELFREAKRGADDESEERGVFAHVNEATVRSLGGIGISVARFAGRADLRSPASQPGTHDDRYYPAYVTARHRNGELFSALEEIAADAFVLDPRSVEVVIDLRDSVIGGTDAGRAASDGPREQPVQQ